MRAPLLILALLLAACAPADSGVDTYQHPEFGYELDLPASWEGSYMVEEQGDVTRFVFTDAEPRQHVFTVAALVREEWDRLAQESGGASPNLQVVGESAERVFAISSTFDNPYEGEAQRRYDAMAADLPAIASSFRL